MMPSGVRQRDSYTYKLYGSHCEGTTIPSIFVSILTLIGVSKIVPGGIPTKWRPFVVSDSRMIPAGGPK
ncbi:hypothetical protein HRG_006632 [Hirsutella rhossiliensis]